jgi:hypothetical protein
MSKKFIKSKKVITLGLTALMCLGSTSSLWSLPEGELDSIALNPFSITVYAADTSQFKDSIPEWATSDINYLVGKGIMKGYEDGTFRANGTMTRLEFLTAVVRSLKTDSEIDSLIADLKTKYTFDDYDKISDYQYYVNMVEDTLKQSGTGQTAENFWGTRYLVTAYATALTDGGNGILYTNIMIGDEIGWTQYITRQEAATVMYNALTRVKGESLPSTKYIHNIISDYNQIESDRAGAVASLISNGLIAGIDDNFTFAPEQTLTRAQACCILARITDNSRRLDKPVVPEDKQVSKTLSFIDDSTYHNPVTGKDETHSSEEWNEILNNGVPSYSGKTNGEISSNGYFEWNSVLAMWVCLAG